MAVRGPQVIVIGACFAAALGSIFAVYLRAADRFWNTASERYYTGGFRLVQDR